ncbi:MAG: hypothetical protein ABIO96_06905 [Nitrospiraceae bacterium]
MWAPGAKRRNQSASTEEALPVSLVVGWHKELDARWAPVRVVVSAESLRQGIYLSAQSVAFVMAVAGAPEQLELPVAVGHAALPSQSGLMKSVMAQAEL